MNTTARDLVVKRSSDHRVIVESDDKALLDKTQVVLDLVNDQLLAAEPARLDALVRKMVDFLVPGDVSAELMQEARLQAEVRARLLRERGGLVSAEDIHERMGSRSTNVFSTATRLRKKGRIFSVHHQGRQQYPAYQFDDEGRPVRGLDKVLEVLSPALTDWQLAVWFVTPNGWLDGEEPIDRLRAGDVDAVVMAARDETAAAVY